MKKGNICIFELWTFSVWYLFHSIIEIEIPYFWNVVVSKTENKHRKNLAAQHTSILWQEKTCTFFLLRCG